MIKHNIDLNKGQFKILDFQKKKEISKFKKKKIEKENEGKNQCLTSTWAMGST
jgi:hypothetical protein